VKHNDVNAATEAPAPAGQEAVPANVAALQGSADFYRTLAEAAPDMIYAVNRDDVVEYVNPAAAAQIGRKAEEIIGRSREQFFPAITNERQRQSLQKVFETGQPLHLEARTLFPRGYLWLDMWLMPIRDASGRVARVLGVSRDISQRKLAEEAAQASEARYHALAEAAQDMIFTIGKDGMVQFVNSFAAAQLGLRPQDIIGKPRAQFFRGDQSSQQEAALQRVFESGEPLYDESLTTFPDRQIWLGTWLNPVRNEAGEVAAVQGISRDITRRVRAEETLRLQGTALESAANGIVITDTQGNVAWVNQAFTQLTGYGVEEILGRNLRILKSGQHEAKYYQEMWQTILSGRVWRSEVINRRKDGRLYTQEQTVTPVRGARGEVTHFIAIQQDITERKQMEAELRESRQRFARIFQSNPEAITISALDSRRFLDVNDGFLAQLGYERDQVLGRTPAELGLFADAQDRERIRERMLKDGRLRNFEVRLRRQDGTTFDVLMSAESIQLGAEPCLLTITNDITRWKHQQAEMEEKLRQAQKLESLGTLAGGVAHDFNNILTIIQGHAFLLLSDGKLVAESLDSLRQIAQAAERAANLTRQLLTFSRQQPLQRRVLDLNEVVGNMTKMLCRLIGEDIALEIKCSPRLPMVVADVGMMEQVVMNLAINGRDAIHARPNPSEPGRLTIGTESIMAQPPDELDRLDRPLRQYVCLSVRDNGCGIPQEIQERIFDPFFTTKEVGKGTGLGLATVHGIVQEHQGWIDLESSPEQGATFRIFVPASSQESRREIDRHAPPSVRGGCETILLVEDEDALRELAKEILERYGYTVVVASSGRKALEMWEQVESQIDLLLTDVVMPEGINGRQLAEMLDARKPGLKVIYTTGYNTEITGWDFMRADGVYYLQKPYPPHELAQMVRNCLDGVASSGLEVPV
jgi:two-component system, cell cycle sensor histidine kinase and response regulator CckA